MLLGRILDEDIDFAKFGKSLLDGLLAEFFHSDITRDQSALPAGLFNLPLRLFCMLMQ